jgi:DNA (cytosine-5)-methyltransferase 1
MIPRSVVGLTGKEIRKLAGIGNQVVDCVFGGPPCQGFSLIGQRVFDDPRNALVLEFVRIVSELEARTFVFENVKGLTVGKHKAFLEELVNAFDDAGYNVQLPWKVLDAANYGVPQHRQRLIIMGSRKGIDLPEFPDPITNPADCRKLILDLPDGPTCAQAIGDLPDADKFPALLDTDSVSTKSFGNPSEYVAELRGLSNGSWHLGHMRDWNPYLLTSSARTIHTDISRRRFERTGQGDVEPISRFFKLNPKGLCNTLRAGTDGARGAFTSPRPIHYKYARCITVREMARLHGFPDWFRLHATKWHGARQVGNAVPPPMARAIAGAIAKALRVKVRRSQKTLKLGDTSLLFMDISQAAAHFDIVPPSSRRDRKSGRKKRKQHEIEDDFEFKKVANGRR